MNREFIQQVLDKVAADLPQFKKVALFNNQFDKMDEGTIDQFNFPCLFISFPDDVPYTNRAAGVQRTDEFRVRFLIGSSFHTDKEILNAFDLKQKVMTEFDQWQPDNGTTLVRVNEQTDEDRSNYYVFLQDYTTSLVDSTNYVLNGRTEFIIPNLEVNAEIVK